MKQLIQNYKSGELMLAEVPDPLLRPGGVVFRTVNSLVSVGTEKLMISLAKKGYIGKALARPDLVKQVISKIKVDGLMDTYKAAMSRLDSPVTLGYSSAGVVTGVGEGIVAVKPGDRIACFGDGYATHSEQSYVTKNMFVPVPEGVSFEEAAFVGLGSIALNAIRVANLTFGEKVAVVGLGLLGQLTVQMLKAFGCQVIGIDISQAKAEMAKQYGSDRTALIGRDDIAEQVNEFTGGLGADAVIIMAGSQDNKPIELAAEISREHGRIVACGMISLDVPRQEFFKKELSVVVSRATGPGKFDPLYESKGIDYPLPLVRWTTQRNMACFLDLIAAGKVRVKELISHHFPLDDALQAYDMILKGTAPYLGVLLSYGAAAPAKGKVALPIITAARPADAVNLGLIGAGLHSNTSILPALKSLRAANLVAVVDAEGFKAEHTGRKYGFAYCATDYQALLADKSVNAVIIATRHNLHAKMVIDSLRAGKQVFVEKPLALNQTELDEITAAYQAAAAKNGAILMVGFNRRFAPLTVKAGELLGKPGNMVINCRVNAGFVPKESWVHDAAEGGGRVIGEVCHFLDLIQALTGSLITGVQASATAEKGEDNMVISLRLADGSVASLLYASQGDRLLPRERLELFSGNAVCVIDNFKSLFHAKNGQATKKSFMSLDRGYEAEFRAFCAAVKSGRAPVGFREYWNATAATFAIEAAIRSGQPAKVEAGPA